MSLVVLEDGYSEDVMSQAREGGGGAVHRSGRSQVRQIRQIRSPEQDLDIPGKIYIPLVLHVLHESRCCLPGDRYTYEAVILLAVQ